VTGSSGATVVVAGAAVVVDVAIVEVVVSIVVLVVTGVTVSFDPPPQAVAITEMNASVTTRRGNIDESPAYRSAQTAEVRCDLERVVSAIKGGIVVREGRPDGFVEDVVAHSFRHARRSLCTEVFCEFGFEVREKVAAEVEATKDHADLGIGEADFLNGRDVRGRDTEFGESFFTNNVDDVVGGAVGFLLSGRRGVVGHECVAERDRKFAARCRGVVGTSAAGAEDGAGGDQKGEETNRHGDLSIGV
jgi:membrane-associated protease RseP (regulator of RpoE activity)